MDISNGEGCGVSLFVQGCDKNPHCKNCFNPDTWNFNGGLEWTDEVEENFMKLINRPYITRISLLGGECLSNDNLDYVIKLTNEIHVSFPQKTLWLYTGYLWEECIPLNESGVLDPNVYASRIQTVRKKRFEVLKNIDVLVDGEYIEELRNTNLKFRGSSNQRIINVQESLNQGKIIPWYREENYG